MRIITHAIGSYSWEDKSKFRNIPVLCWDKEVEMIMDYFVQYDDREYAGRAS